MTTAPRKPPPRERVDAESILLSLLTSSREHLSVLDTEGRVRLMNPAALDAVGAERVDDVSGRPWTAFWPAAYANRIGQALAASARGEISRFRAWRQSDDGQLGWFDITVTPIFDRITGEVSGATTSCHDVTGAIQTQSILDIIVDSVPTVLFAKSASDGRYVLLSRDAEDIFGLPRDEMLGKTDRDLGVDSPLMWQVEADVIRSGRICTVEEERELGNAGPRILRTKLLATYGEEGPCHIIGVIEDVTDQRRSEQALQEAAERAEAANRAKSEFLANMSHEIRTPLNGVVGVADVLGATELTARQKEMVDLIRSSGDTLARLLSDVLDLARIESGRLEIQTEPFQLADAVREVCALLAPSAEEKGLDFRVAIAPGTEAWVEGDAVRVKQILTNFIGNAVKFTERGGIEVVAAPESDREAAGPEAAGPEAAGPEGPVFRLQVRDTGIGFDAELKKVIFDRFQQADGSITRRFGGSGLGLAISRQLAELMGGQVECDSRPGEGSVFSLVIPLPVAAAAPAGEEGLVDELADQRPLKVLAADDNANNRRVVELVLGQAGAELTMVEDGRQALEAVQEDHFDVVLMDMQMPVMDGLAATRAIRDWEAAQGAGRTPIFMLTANASAADAELCRAAGADRHLAKPISAQKLLSALMDVQNGTGAETQAA